MSLLDRERTVAPAGFNRWLVPTSALSIHLAIGQAYGFSVFNLPMTRLVGLTAPAPDDWKLTSLGWIFSLAIVFLGLAAAFGGTWVERAGPRKAMLASAICFSGGFLVSAVGVELHALWLVYLGYGVLGGIGLGLGYVSPVKTLITWFPDRPGMATGLAIMGFGGGAMIGSPLAVALMDHFKSATSLGVAPTFACLGVGYFAFMLWGVVTVRVPPAGWAPPGFVAGARGSKMISHANVSARSAVRTPQFVLLWLVLFLNVTAGIGVLGQASAISQEMFPGRITPAAAAGFVGLLSLFNMGGRFVWSSLSGPQADLRGVLRAGHGALRADAGVGSTPEHHPVRRHRLRHLEHVRRGLRDHSRVPERPVRQGPGQRNSRSPAHRVVGSGRGGAGAGQLPARIPARPRREAGRRVRLHHGPDGRAAGGGVRLQRAGAAGRGPLPRTRGLAMNGRLKLVVGWVWVGGPLAWGIWQTALKAAQLFASP
jgi:MFS family permease